ncbi:MAG: Fic family protein [Leptolyngbya sp. DLM2.Bin27]|nr:MAG: Fic family protein [Leptolyngbya sp. DLM2.Bin27]
MADPTPIDILQDLDALKTQLDALRPLAPDLLSNLRELYTVRLTYNSTAIEGNTLTETETQIVLEKGITIGGKSLRDHLEVINHAEAIDFVRDLAQANTPITEWEIRQIHSLVCKGDRQAGAYRSVNVIAAGTNYRYPDAINVPDLMADFGDWISQPPPQHPVEIATEIHARFVTIHPFTDGNGRVARLLMNLHLLRTGYPLAIIQAADRAAYIDAVVAWQAGKTKPLLVMVAKVVKSSALEILSLVN